MDVYQAKFEFEFSKDNLLETILQNREDWETAKVAQAIKEFVKNHDRYSTEKKRILDILAHSE